MIAPGCVRWASSAAARARPKSRILTRPRLLLQPEVGRLDVAVDQPALVGRRQARRRSRGRCAAPRPAAASPSPLAAVVERLAFEQLHRQEGHAAVLADLVDGDDVVVLDGRGRPAPRAGSARGPRRWPPATGSITLRATSRSQVRVLRLEDDAHAAGAQHLQHAVGPQPAELARPAAGPGSRRPFRSVPLRGGLWQEASAFSKELTRPAGGRGGRVFADGPRASHHSGDGSTPDRAASPGSSPAAAPTPARLPRACLPPSRSGSVRHICPQCNRCSPRRGASAGGT